MWIALAERLRRKRLSAVLARARLIQSVELTPSSPVDSGFMAVTASWSASATSSVNGADSFVSTRPALPRLMSRVRSFCGFASRRGRSVSMACLRTGFRCSTSSHWRYSRVFFFGSANSGFSILSTKAIASSRSCGTRNWLSVSISWFILYMSVPGMSLARTLGCSRARRRRRYCQRLIRSLRLLTEW